VKYLVKIVIVCWIFSITVFSLYPKLSYCSNESENILNNSSKNEKRYQLSITDESFSINARNANAEKILEEIADKMGIEIKILSPIKETITISFKNLSLEARES
jgi:predicted nucleic acid-binding protein